MSSIKIDLRIPRTRYAPTKRTLPANIRNGSIRNYVGFGIGELMGEPRRHHTSLNDSLPVQLMSGS